MVNTYYIEDSGVFESISNVYVASFALKPEFLVLRQGPLTMRGKRSYKLDSFTAVQINATPNTPNIAPQMPSIHLLDFR